MKKNILILLMPLLFVFACDSQQDSAPAEKAKVVAPETMQKEATVTKAPTVTTNTAPTTPSTTETETETTKVATTAPAKTEEKQALSGEQVYTKHCMNCHKSGVANAPKLGDAKEWGVRLAKGKETLYQSAKSGIPGTAMMAKGTCSACSEAELEATVDFMISKSQ